MTPLPFDHARCMPYEEPAEKCKTCPRWSDHPEQTWGPRTPLNERNPETCGENEK